MSHSYKIISAAVEQKLQFPSQASYDAFVTNLITKKESFELIGITEHVGGYLTVVMRRCCSNYDFLAARNGHCGNCGLFDPVDHEGGFCYGWQSTVTRTGYCHEWMERVCDDV